MKGESTSFERKWLDQQGYQSCSINELKEHRFGIRFAYVTCVLLVIAGLVSYYGVFFIVAGIIAFFGMFPPYHPLDYLYNGVIRHLLKKPKLPPRANQGRFACVIATSFLAGMIYGYYSGNPALVYVLGGLLLIPATLVSTTDICIPSIIYNFFGKRFSSSAGS